MTSKFYPPPKNEEAGNIFSEVISGMISIFNNPSNVKVKKEESSESDPKTPELESSSSNGTPQKSTNPEPANPPNNIFYPTANNNDIEDLHFNDSFLEEISCNDSIPPATPINMPDFSKPSPTANDKSEQTPKKKVKKKAKAKSPKSPVSVKLNIDDGKTPKAKVESESESKPRIVLTFRSEKSGSKNVKIVSEEEKMENKRRSTRSKGSPSISESSSIDAKKERVKRKLLDDDAAKKTSKNAGTESDDSSKVQVKKFKKQAANHSDGEDSLKETPSVKRSTRFKTREQGDNAVTKKELSNDTVSRLPSRLSRRIKPTEKVLANRILRKGFESQNNARLALISESTSQNQEDTKTLRPRPKKTGEKVDVKKGNKINKRMNLISSKKLSKKKSVSDEMSIDDINNCIFGKDAIVEIVDDNTPPKKTKKVHEEDATEEEIQERHLNRLKKKHLQKLGLQAIPVNTENNFNEEALSDESTMDSIMTDAIVEHFNTRNHPSAESSPLKDNDIVSIFQEEIDDESSTEISNENSLQICDLETEKELTFTSQEVEKEAPPTPPSPPHTRQTRGSRVMYNMFVESDSDEEEDEDDDDDEEVIIPRITRKRSSMQNSSRDEETPVKNANKNQITSPSTADNGNFSPNRPIGSFTDAVSCLCVSKTNIYYDLDATKETEFCRAVDWVENRLLGCGRVADPSLPLIRAHVRTPYILACDMHRTRMALHQCCAGCGLFCTQGIFFRCNEGHLFHGECSLPLIPLHFPFTKDRITPERESAKLGCPHCGEDSKIRLPVNVDCRKVKLQLKCKKSMVLLPSPRKQWEPAFMSFSNKTLIPEPSKPDYEPPMPMLPTKLLTMLRSDTAHAENKDNVDYDDLLMKMNRKQTEAEEVDLITAICTKEDSVSHIVDALLAGEDPRKPIVDADGGNCLHLAAREFNLPALHLFKMLKCELDVFDSKQRTPFMLAFISYDTHMTQLEKVEAEAEESYANRGIDESAKESREKEKLVMEKTKDVFKNKFLSVIKYLVKAGADITLKGPEGVTVLHLAAKISDVSSTSILLENNIHISRSFINEKDVGGWTALVWAAENKNTQIVRYLVEMGADPMIPDSENNVALHWTVLTGCAESTELLLNAGTHVNAINAQGDTPLHVAARQNHYDCLVILLARGAKIDIKNNNEETPLDCITDNSSNCYSALMINLHLQSISNNLEKSERIVCNDISNGKESYPIQCVNAMDDEDVIGEFLYVTENVLTTDLDIDRKITSMDLCQCQGRCDQSVYDCVCSNLGIKCWYDSNHRLVSNFDYFDPPMIFECNYACSCNVNQCLNRCVGSGPRVSLQVFRLGIEGARGSGWGVRTLQPIPKGTFVTEYIGELLTTNEAYKRNEDSYLFQLEVKSEILDDTTSYCIDAKSYGNISRFINHKCVPNLLPIRVFVHHRDLRFPRIAFFALKDIKIGEELGFDYGEKFWSVKMKSFSCNCCSVRCRYANVSEEMEMEMMENGIEDSDESKDEDDENTND